MISRLLDGCAVLRTLLGLSRKPCCRIRCMARFASGGSSTSPSMAARAPINRPRAASKQQQQQPLLYAIYTYIHVYVVFCFYLCRSFVSIITVWCSFSFLRLRAPPTVLQIFQLDVLDAHSIAHGYHGHTRKGRWLLNNPCRR